MEHGCGCLVFQVSAKVGVRGEGIAESKRFYLPTSPSQTQPRAGLRWREQTSHLPSPLVDEGGSQVLHAGLLFTPLSTRSLLIPH